MKTHWLAFSVYVDNVVMMSESWSGLQRLRNKLYESCTSSSLDVNLSKTRITIFGLNKRKLNQEAFHLGNDRIDKTHEYKSLGIDFYSCGYFEASSWKTTNCKYETLMATSRKETTFGVACWKPKSHSFKVLVLPTFTCGSEILGGDLKALIERFLRRVWRYIWCLVSKCVLWQPTIFYWLDLETFPHGFISSSSSYRFSTTTRPHALLVVSQSSILVFSTTCQPRVWHLTQMDNMWKASRSLSCWKPMTTQHHQNSRSMVSRRFFPC